MLMLTRLWFVWAGLNGAAAVALAAYAAHGMRDADPYVLDVMGKATHMQGLHGAVLAGVAALTLWRPTRLLHLSAALLAAGLLLFCGALYGIALAGLPTAAIAPFGGTAMIAGWLMLGLAGLGLTARPTR